MASTCTCIIPLYNEEAWILRVLEKISSVSFFDRIVLVDDGSVDGSVGLIQKFIDQHTNLPISLVSYPDNHGKSYAVKQWLDLVDTDYVFMFDADLHNIDTQEIETVITTMYAHPHIDMGIMRRVLSKWYIKILYRELILSGQRMMRTEELRKVYTQTFDRYQLEIAINTYMSKHHKTVVWFPFSGENSLKHQKWWFWWGWKKDIHMFKDIFAYQWAYFYVKHSLTFSPKLYTHHLHHHKK